MASTNPTVPEFTIVGASPAGYTFALSLLQQCPELKPSEVMIIETNSDWRRPGGPFWLAPNALRILDSMATTTDESIYERLQYQGYRGQKHTIRDDSGTWLGALPHGGKNVWGYDALRIERGTLLKLLAEEVQAKGVYVQYDTSLRAVLSEDDDGVEIQIRKGGAEGELSTLRTKRLIGADGAHSRTRPFVCGEEVKPIYSGNFMIGGYLPRAKLQWTKSFQDAADNEEYALSITDRGGTLIMIPVDYDAELLGIGRQWPLAEPDRRGWEALNADKQNLHDMFTADAAQWSEFPRNILEAAKLESPDMWHVWPFYLLPKLNRWVSESGKAVIIGDAAHTLIPAAAQGACQAIEDAATLAKAYSHGLRTPQESGILREWQTKRIKRVEQIAGLSVQLMNVRLPPEAQAKLKPDELFPLDGSEDERNKRLDWLYGFTIEESR